MYSKQITPQHESIWKFIRHQLLDLESELRKRIQDIEESPARLETLTIRKRLTKIKATREFLLQLEHLETKTQEQIL